MINQNIEHQLDPIFEAAIDSKRVPGVAAIALDKDGNTIFSKGYGTVRFGDPDAAKVTTQCPLIIFSCTKLLTTTAALQLIEEGRLSLDDEVEKYVPEIKIVKVIEGFDEDGTPKLREPSSKPKIVHLLTHTAGFTYDFFDATTLKYRTATGQLPSLYAGLSDWSTYSTPLLFEPGSQYEYGVSTDWLGLVVQNAAGIRLDKFIDERIIQPLGLKNTGLGVGADRPDFFNIHLKDGEGNLTPTPIRNPTDLPIVAGGHYAYSTAEEYAQFLLTIINDGTHPASKVTLLKPETVREYLFKDQLPALGVTQHQVGHIKTSMPPFSTRAELLPGTPKGWSLGMLTNSEDTPNGRKAGSAGWCGLANSYYWMDPAGGKLGFLSASLFPFTDKDVLHLFDALERAVYGRPMAKEKGEPGSNFAGAEYVVDP